MRWKVTLVFKASRRMYSVEAATSAKAVSILLRDYCRMEMVQDDVDNIIGIEVVPEAK